MHPAANWHHPPPSAPGAQHARVFNQPEVFTHQPDVQRREEWPRLEKPPTNTSKTAIYDVREMFCRRRIDRRLKAGHNHHQPQDQVSSPRANPRDVSNRATETIGTACYQHLLEKVVAGPSCEAATGPGFEDRRHPQGRQRSRLPRPHTSLFHPQAYFAFFIHRFFRPRDRLPPHSRTRPLVSFQSMTPCNS